MESGGQVLSTVEEELYSTYSDFTQTQQKLLQTVNSANSRFSIRESIKERNHTTHAMREFDPLLLQTINHESMQIKEEPIECEGKEVETLLAGEKFTFHGIEAPSVMELKNII